MVCKIWKRKYGSENISENMEAKIWSKRNGMKEGNMGLN
jgi:hypothetical protein